MSELLDRLHAEASESDRTWSPEEIAGRLLRMKPGPGTPALVRAILAADGRFHESADGNWEARSTPAARLADGSYRLCWFEVGEGEELRVHLALWTPGVPPAPPSVIDGTDPSRWVSRADEVLGQRWATLQPALCARWFWRMDRRWALGETSQPPLDLLSWSRLALLDGGIEVGDLRQESSPDRLAEHWSLGGHGDDGPGRLRLVGQVLDRLLERYPDWTDAELEAAETERLRARPVDASRFEFPLGALGGVPHVPGVYRLHGEGGVLVYVGKALDLGRRIQEHFRPLPPERTKREEMLDEVRRFEVEELPSELEALVREHRAIVDNVPRWNVQVEINAPKRFPPDWSWPLIYIAPGEGAVRTLVVLTGADRGALLRLGPGCRVGPWISDLMASLALDVERGADCRTDHGTDQGADTGLDQGADTDDAPDGGIGRGGHPAGDLVPTSEDSVWLLRPAEAWLALRYFVRFRDRIDRIDPLAALSPEDLAVRVARLAEDTAEVHPREVRG